LFFSIAIKEVNISYIENEIIGEAAKEKGKKRRKLVGLKMEIVRQTSDGGDYKYLSYQ